MITGDCETGGTSVGGYMGWIQAGPQIRVLLPVGDRAISVAARATVGARAILPSRSAKLDTLRCTNCRRENVAAGGGAFVSPGLELGYAFGTTAEAGAIGIRGAYEYYLAGDATMGLWLSAFLAGFL